jgi:hypothetical protein
MAHRPVSLLACRVFQSPLRKALPPATLKRASFLDHGLHQVPRQLNAAIQQQVNAITEPGLVALGYGLCGNGLHGIEAGRHTLLIPRMDDCIAMFMGSYAAYRTMLTEEPGTYTLTKGWLEAGADPLAQYERLLKHYDNETAQWIMNEQFKHYKRLLFVAPAEAVLTAYRPQAGRVAAYCAQWGMRYEERLGTTAFIEQFAQAIASASVGQPVPLADFILIEPGITLTQQHFRREGPPWSP